MRVVIAGGGLTGLTAGVALLRAGHDVVVVERAPAIRAAGSGIGLWRNAINVFERIGLGAQVGRISTVIDTWFFDPAGHRLRAEGFTAEDHQLILIPRGALNDLLAGAIGPSRIRLGAGVTGFDERPDGVAVRLSDGEVLSADLLIGADGVHSSVRARLVPGSEPVPHAGHYAWRALVPAGQERHASTVLTIGHQRTRGGYSRISGDRTMWMVNQLMSWLSREPDRSAALHGYERARMLRFDQVRRLSADVEAASGAAEFAGRYATFSHWMLTTEPAAYPQ